MSSNFDLKWLEEQNWAAAVEERKEMQEAFERFHKSKEWGMVCMIYESDDYFDIVIRDEEDINCRCLYGQGWKKSYLTPEQLKSVPNPLRMSGLGISTADITAAVESQNIQAAAGSIGTEHSNRYINFKLNVKGRLIQAEEFGNIILRHDTDGSIVRLRDVANVEIGFKNRFGK